MIPKDKIERVTTKTGIADAIETIYVRHTSGGISEIGLKSYDQQRDSFQGTNRHVIWLDEEPPGDIYVESLLRTMVVNGLVLVTATPLLGMTDVMRSFIQPSEEEQAKFFVQATWDDVPHLDAAAKQNLLASIPPYQREARSKGVPQLGAGAIYQIPESDIVVPDFEIPDHYPRAYGLDVGWKKTAAVWGARDNETGVIYLYSEHYQGLQQPSLHADAIKARGKWIPGVIDPAAQGRTQTDGIQLIQLYRDCGLNLQPAINAVESGLYDCWQLMSSGKLKVFASLGNWLQEFRLYQRDTDGKVVKANDHLMDAFRYLVTSGRERMCTKPKQQTQHSSTCIRAKIRCGGCSEAMNGGSRDRIFWAILLAAENHYPISEFLSERIAQRRALMCSALNMRRMQYTCIFQSARKLTTFCDSRNF